MTESDRDLYQKLMGKKCVCGATKKPRMSHCSKCYWALPNPQRRALYNLIGQGYGEAFAASVETLKAAGRVVA